MSSIYGAEHLLRMLGTYILHGASRQLVVPACGSSEAQGCGSHVYAFLTLCSEFAANGGEFHHGPGVCGAGAGLCERAACVGGRCVLLVNCSDD